MAAATFVKMSAVPAAVCVIEQFRLPGISSALPPDVGYTLGGFTAAHV